MLGGKIYYVFALLYVFLNEFVELIRYKSLVDFLVYIYLYIYTQEVKLAIEISTAHIISSHHPLHNFTRENKKKGSLYTTISLQGLVSL